MLRKISNKPYHALRLLSKNLGGFLRFEILFKLLSVFVFFPLIDRFERIALRLSGIRYLSNYNLHRTLSNPIVWLTCLLILIFTGLFSAAEMLGLSVGIHAAYNGEKLSARQMLGEGISRILGLCRVKNLFFVPYVFLMLPVADLYDAFSIFQNYSVISFLWGWLSRRRYFREAFVVLFALLTFFAIEWIYTIPIIIAEKKDFREAHQKSARLQYRRFLQTVFAGLFWVVLIVAFFVGLVAGLLFLLRLLLPWLDPSLDPRVAVSDEAVLLIEMVVLLLATWLISPIMMIRIQMGYYRRLVEEGEEVSEFAPSRHLIRENKWMGYLVWAGIIACGYFFIPPVYQQAKMAIYEGGRDTMIMAHRGDSGSAPENTLPAFQSAIDHGAGAVELDVQMTKDGVVVCLHDSSLRRTTGVNKKIWEVNYDEIKDLDNGSFFDPRFRFTRIPTLDQALKLMKGSLYVNIEIKRTGHDEGIVEKTLEIIAANHYEKECDITSMDYNTLRQVKSLAPEIYTVYTTTVGGGDIVKLSAANAFSVEENFVNAGLVQYLRKSGKGIYVWTVNSETQINRMIDLDVDAIITNNVSLARGLLESNQGITGITHRIRRVLLSL